MLRGLDEVDWRSLRHAFGKASDIPGTICALISGDDSARDDALSELFGSIWHQGTVYEASPHAVPFLIELLGPSSPADKVGILGLLGCLATGSSYLDVHARGSSAVSRKLRQSPDFDQKLARELAWVRATQKAVASGLQVYLDLLNSHDWELRLAAAQVLGTCTDHRAVVAPRLRGAIASEADDRARFGLILCLEGVASAEDAEMLRAIISGEASDLYGFDPSPPGCIRWAAATVLCQVAREETPPEAIQTLSMSFAAPESIDEYLRRMPWDRPEAIETTCLALDQVGPRLAVPVLVDGLRVVDEYSVMSLTTHLLDITFPENLELTIAQSHPCRAASTLSPHQRAGLSALVARVEAWHPSWCLNSQLRQLGLPDSRDELRRFLAR